MQMGVTLLQALRDELVPVIIVVSLLALYAQQIIAAGDPPGDLKTLVATVVAFYFGKAVSRQTAVDVQRATNAATDAARATTNGNGH